MTTYNKSTLATFFQQGDVPSGTDYSNLIDSCVNVAETSTQSMQGALNPTELITPRVSATNGVFTGTFQVGGIMSANTLYVSNLINASATTFQSLGVTTDISAGGTISAVVDVSAGGTVYASAMRSTVGFIGSVGIVSAAGTAQGTAALLTNTINRCFGVVDGTTTGFAIPANRTGLTQVAFNVAGSANLWPPTGGTINGLGTNAAFAMAAATPYAIYHITASAYAVK